MSVSNGSQSSRRLLSVPGEVTLLRKELSNAEKGKMATVAELIGSRTNPAQPCTDPIRCAELKKLEADYSAKVSTLFRILMDRERSCRGVDHLQKQHVKVDLETVDGENPRSSSVNTAGSLTSSRKLPTVTRLEGQVKEAFDRNQALRSLRPNNRGLNDFNRFGKAPKRLNTFLNGQM